jgi:hypothetical protein
LFDVVLCNDNYTGELDPRSRWVRADERSMQDSRIYTSDLVDENRSWHHDSRKLSQVLIDLYNERTGPLRDVLQ